MSNLNVILQMTETLSQAELKALEDYIQTLKEQDYSHQKPSERILGLHASHGAAWISEDFTAPLSDAFWLGEE